MDSHKGISTHAFWPRAMLSKNLNKHRSTRKPRRNFTPKSLILLDITCVSPVWFCFFCSPHLLCAQTPRPSFHLCSSMTPSPSSRLQVVQDQGGPVDLGRIQIDLPDCGAVGATPPVEDPDDWPDHDVSSAKSPLVERVIIG